MKGGAGRSVSLPYIAHFLNWQGLECHAYLKDKQNTFLIFEILERSLLMATGVPSKENFALKDNFLLTCILFKIDS